MMLFTYSYDPDLFRLYYDSKEELAWFINAFSCPFHVNVPPRAIFDTLS